MAQGEQMNRREELATEFWQRVFDKIIAANTLADLERWERQFRAGALIKWEVQQKTGAESELSLAARVSADFGVKLAGNDDK